MAKFEIDQIVAEMAHALELAHAFISGDEGRPSEVEALQAIEDAMAIEELSDIIFRRVTFQRAA